VSGKGTGVKVNKGESRVNLQESGKKTEENRSNCGKENEPNSIQSTLASVIVRVLNGLYNLQFMYRERELGKT
jgi:hypothetical protein